MIFMSKDHSEMALCLLSVIIITGSGFSYFDVQLIKAVWKKSLSVIIITESGLMGFCKFVGCYNRQLNLLKL